MKETRICSICRNKKELSPDNFCRDGSRPCGFGYRCKSCLKEQRYNSPPAKRERERKRYREYLEFNNLKLCSKCKKELDVSCFNKDPTNIDGLECRCRECKKEAYGKRESVTKAREKREKEQKKRELLTKKGLKLCSRCKTEKPFEDFYECKEAIDGHKHWCMACYSEYRKRKEYKDYIKRTRQSPENKKSTLLECAHILQFNLEG